MRIVSAISSLPDGDALLQDLEEQLKGSLQNQTPDLLLLLHDGGDRSKSVTHDPAHATIRLRFP